MVKLTPFRDDPISVSSLRPGDIVQEGNCFRFIVSVTRGKHSLSGYRSVNIVWLIAGHLRGPVHYMWNTRLPLKRFRGTFGS